MQELEVSLFNGTKENAAEALQPYEGSNWWLLGVLTLSQEKGFTQSIGVNQEAKGMVGWWARERAQTLP